MRSLRRYGVAAVLTAAALALAGCGGGSSKSSSAGSSSSGGTSGSATKNDINATPRDDVQQGGTLRWAIDGAIANFNYNELDTDYNAQVLDLALMPSVFHSSAAAKFTVNTDYFTDVKLTSSEPQTIEYDINPKAVWSDGSQITANDFIAQWKALNGTNSAYNAISTTGYDQIASVTQGSSAQQAIVTFSKPYGDWKGLFSPLYPASVNSDPNTFNTGLVNAPTVTSGPFQFASQDTSAQTYTLTPNPRWWGNKPKLDSIVFRVIADDATIDSLANKEIDVDNIGPDVNAYKRAKTLSNAAVRRAAGPNYRQITINGSGPILKDVKVRQAIQLAINRKAIAQSLLGPFGGTPSVLNNHIYMSNQAGYQDNSGIYGSADVAKANKELQADGWTRKGSTGTRTKGGKPLTISYVIPSQVAATAQESQLVQSMLAQVGVKVTIKTVPSNDFFVKYITPGAYDMTSFAYIGTPFPVGGSVSLFAKPVGDNIQQNLSRVGSDAIDTAFDKAAQDLTPAAQMKDANAADELLWKQANMIMLYQRPDLWGVTKNVANVGAFGFQDFRYEDMGFTK